jgi:hypothetical protein
VTLLFGTGEFCSGICASIGVENAATAASNPIQIAIINRFRILLVLLNSDFPP